MRQKSACLESINDPNRFGCFFSQAQFPELNMRAKLRPVHGDTHYHMSLVSYNESMVAFLMTNNVHHLIYFIKYLGNMIFKVLKIIYCSLAD